MVRWPNRKASLHQIDPIATGDRRQRWAYPPNTGPCSPDMWVGATFSHSEDCMSKLNQIVAVVAGKKSDGEKAITALYHQLQKPTLFEGISKSYEALREDGEQLPPETKLLQFKVAEAIAQFREAMTPVFDVTFTQDLANTRAKADIAIDGVTLLVDVPVPYLLFLEKRLTDLHTFISKLPTLDPAQRWTYSRDTDCFVTAESWKYHTKKLVRVMEKAPATDKHPAQVDLIQEDVNVGRWKTTNMSGAIPAKDQHDMLVRVKQLIEAVKKSRELANMLEVENAKAGEAILDFVFGV